MKTIPIAEVFGPTLQGEGALAGRPTYFVRVGGCDFACLWCDSNFAVLADKVRELPRYTQDEIFDQLLATLRPGPYWLTISGGNPALYDLEDLVQRWQRYRFDGHDGRVAVETQGTRWREWLGKVNLLTVSPKPPSSGMDGRAQLDDFMHAAGEWLPSVDREYKVVRRLIFKVVVFDEVDYQWARDLHLYYPGVDFYLSCGTGSGGLSGEWAPPDAGRNRSPIDEKDNLLDRYRWLAERAMSDSAMADAAIFPQLHALAWGITAKGV